VIEYKQKLNSVGGDSKWGKRVDAEQLGRLILYIISHVEELGGCTTTIRLVKFLYLIDLEHQRRYGQTLTGLDWVYYRYGPYAFEIPEIGTRLGFDLQREEFVSAQGHSGNLLRSWEPQNFPTELSYGIEVMTNVVLGVWADLETDLLLSYVYDTEPMRQAQRGDRLDFSVVPLGTRYYELYVSVPERTARQLRESLRSYAQEDADEFVRPDTVFDDALAAGLRALEDEEDFSSEIAGTRLEIDADSLRGSLPCEG
jgi:hypothetical protein